MMYKYFLVSIIVSIAATLSAQDFAREKMSTRMLEFMESRDNNSTDVYIVLTDQIEIDRMVDSFNMANTPFKERAIVINKRLRTIADRSQGQVLEKLNQLGIQQITPIWVVNSLFFRANPDELATISSFAAIKYMDLDTPLELEEPVEQVMDHSPRSANGRKEPGLDIINAPKMWAKGYTGYGTKAFIMDTGVDPTHPALNRNYAGHVVPADQAWFGPTGQFGRPYDCQNHGTHCTGTILGIDRELRDTIGVAYNAMWMGAPILLVCNGSTALRMAGFQWSMDPDDNPETTDDMADVINNSWSDTMVEDCYEVYEQLLTTVDAAGIAIVFAGGNDGPGAATMSRPKNIGKTLVNTFAVGAVDGNNLNIADFSSRGPSRCDDTEGSLRIKPEVSAPGVAVRSSIPGNAYANFSGTSMAAPHVAGAILLLKEAFPYLSGETIKLALYFSAIDLGEPGEDNVYGMGLIDVDAAFQYLLNEGHIPVDPSAQIDLNVENYSITPLYCNEEILINVVLSNNGAQDIHGFRIDLYLDENAAEPFLSINNPTSLTPGQIVDWTIEAPVLQDGVYSMMARVWPTGQIDEKPLNNSVRLFFIYNKVEDWDLNIDAEILNLEWCGGTKLLLENESEDGSVLWFRSEDAVAPDFIGNQHLLDLPNADTTIFFHLGFRQERQLFSSEEANYFSEILPEEQTGIEFSTNQNVFMSSFKLNCTTRTFLNLQLVGDDGRSFWTSNRFYNAGENTILVNTQIPQNQTIRLIVTANRDLLAGQFDELFNDAYLKLRSVLANNQPSEENLSVFYDIDVYYDIPCDRKPIAIQVKSVDEAPKAQFTILPDQGVMTVLQEILFVNESEGAERFEWDFGDGNTSMDDLPTHMYTEGGTYIVKLTALDEAGCSDVFLQEIIVEDDESTSTSMYSLENTLEVYPNPAYNEIYIQSGERRIIEVQLIGIDGRYMKPSVQDDASNSFRVDLGGLSVPPGFYILKATFEDGQNGVARIVIQ